MPITKNVQVRLKRIDECLKNGRKMTRKQLANKCNVSTKTIERDIEVLRNTYNAPIESGQLGYYYYENFSFGIDIAISSKEISQLKVAINILNHHKEMDVFKNLSGLVTKLEKAVKFQLYEETAHYISFEKVPYYKGTELIDFFIEAIEDRRIVSFDYLSFKSEQLINHSINPYILKEHTNRWYIIGFVSEYNSFTLFALERIIQNENLILSEETFRRNKEFDIEKMFRYTYGMTVLSEKKPEKIRLEFTSLQGKYFESKPFCQYSIIEKTSENLIIETELIINYELIRKIASFGSGVKIVTPSSLKNDVISFFNDAINKY